MRRCPRFPARSQHISRHTPLTTTLVCLPSCCPPPSTAHRSLHHQPLLLALTQSSGKQGGGQPRSSASPEKLHRVNDILKYGERKERKPKEWPRTAAVRCAKVFCACSAPASSDAREEKSKGERTQPPACLISKPHPAGQAVSAARVFTHISAAHDHGNPGPDCRGRWCGFVYTVRGSGQSHPRPEVLPCGCCARSKPACELYPAGRPLPRFPIHVVCLASF